MIFGTKKELITDTIFEEKTLDLVEKISGERPEDIYTESNQALDVISFEAAMDVLIDAVPAGGGGTKNYEELQNKPKIGNVEVIGNKSLNDYGIASKTEVTTLENEVAQKASTQDLISGLAQKASLGDDGKVLSSQLPSYVDDVLEYPSREAFPNVGEASKIYVATDVNKTYRWSGSAYVEVGGGVSLGTTHQTAAYGDEGAAAYTHSTTTGNPHGTQFSEVLNKPTTLSGYGITDKVIEAYYVDFVDVNELGNFKAFHDGVEIGFNEIATAFKAGKQLIGRYYYTTLSVIGFIDDEYRPDDSECTFMCINFYDGELYGDGFRVTTNSINYIGYISGTFDYKFGIKLVDGVYKMFYYENGWVESTGGTVLPEDDEDNLYVLLDSSDNTTAILQFAKKESGKYTFARVYKNSENALVYDQYVYENTMMGQTITHTETPIGGGSGSEKFLVTFEWDEEEESIVHSDKTYKEIYDAFNEGKVVYGVLNDLLGSLHVCYYDTEAEIAEIEWKITDLEVSEEVATREICIHSGNYSSGTTWDYSYSEIGRPLHKFCIAFENDTYKLYKIENEFSSSRELMTSKIELPFGNCVFALGDYYCESILRATALDPMINKISLDRVYKNSSGNLIYDQYIYDGFNGGTVTHTETPIGGGSGSEKFLVTFEWDEEEEGKVKSDKTAKEIYDAYAEGKIVVGEIDDQLFTLFECSAYNNLYTIGFSCTKCYDDTHFTVEGIRVKECTGDNKSFPFFYNFTYSIPSIESEEKGKFLIACSDYNGNRWVEWSEIKEGYNTKTAAKAGKVNLVSFQQLTDYNVIAFTNIDATSLSSLTVGNMLFVTYGDKAYGGQYVGQVSEGVYGIATDRVIDSFSAREAYVISPDIDLGTYTLGEYGHAEGEYSGTAGKAAHAEGIKTVAYGKASHAEGEESYAVGKDSHAEGYHTESFGDFSHAEGKASYAKGEDSHAEGYASQALGTYSHAEGGVTKASGTASHSEGESTVASGHYTHAEGYKSKAIGELSHAEGRETEANGYASHTEGHGTHTKSYASHAQGKFNVIDNSEVYADIVGNGTESARSNAYALTWEGTGRYAGDVYVNCNSDSTGGKKLATQEYVDEHGGGDNVFIVNFESGEEDFKLNSDKTMEEIYNAFDSGKIVEGRYEDFVFNLIYCDKLTTLSTYYDIKFTTSILGDYANENIEFKYIAYCKEAAGTSKVFTIAESPDKLICNITIDESGETITCDYGEEDIYYAYAGGKTVEAIVTKYRQGAIHDQNLIFRLFQAEKIPGEGYQVTFANGEFDKIIKEIDSNWRYEDDSEGLISTYEYGFKGDILYASNVNEVDALSIGTTGQVLTVSEGVPSWKNAPSDTLVVKTVYDGDNEYRADKTADEIYSAAQNGRKVIMQEHFQSTSSDYSYFELVNADKDNSDNYYIKFSNVDNYNNDDYNLHTITYSFRTIEKGTSSSVLYSEEYVSAPNYPSLTGEAGKVLKVREDEEGFEWKSTTPDLPTTDGEYMLKIRDGVATWVTEKEN